MQVFHASVLLARIVAVPIVVFYDNKTVVVAACNAVLVGAALCTVSLRDKMFEGLLLILLFYGIGQFREYIHFKNQYNVVHQHLIVATENATTNDSTTMYTTLNCYLIRSRDVSPVPAQLVARTHYHHTKNQSTLLSSVYVR